MTVIAYNRGFLAADTQSNQGRTVRGYVDKIGRTKDGWLWGFTGTADFQEACVAWAEHRAGPPPDIKEPNDNSIFILISPDGHVREWNGHGWYETKPCEFNAWGSGADFALGAMSVGASAAYAVEIACRFCVYCGGETTVYRLQMAEAAE